MDTCTAYCVAKRFQFRELLDTFRHKHAAAVYRDVMHVRGREGDAILFPFGVAVLWAMDAETAGAFLEEVEAFSTDSHETPYRDDFTFEVSGKGVRIHEDHIQLGSDDVFEKIAVSYGIAQSLKLSELEAYTYKTIESTAHIPHNLASTGKTRLSSSQIAKLRGRLFIEKSDVSLNFELLDTPEFFWEYPEAEPGYIAVYNYLDVTARIEILNNKLSIIHELLQILADEHNHKHSTRLEWIIIWLIAFEVVYFILKEIVRVIK